MPSTKHTLKMSVNQFIARKTFNLNLKDKFSNMFLADIIRSMSANQAKIINDFLRSVELDDFIFADNLERFNSIVKIYNDHVESLDDYWIDPI